MATPYEFVAHQLRLHLPGARVEPFIDASDTSRRDSIARLYGDEIDNDDTTFNLSYPGGYPFYYPLQVTPPGSQRPLLIRIAPSFDYLQRFTRPGAEIREYLA